MGQFKKRHGGDGFRQGHKRDTYVQVFYFCNHDFPPDLHRLRRLASADDQSVGVTTTIEVIGFTSDYSPKRMFARWMPLG